MIKFMNITNIMYYGKKYFRFLQEKHLISTESFPSQTYSKMVWAYLLWSKLKIFPFLGKEDEFLDVCDRLSLGSDTEITLVLQMPLRDCYMSLMKRPQSSGENH